MRVLVVAFSLLYQSPTVALGEGLWGPRSSLRQWRTLSMHK